MRPSRLRSYDPEPLPEPRWYWSALGWLYFAVVAALMFAATQAVAQETGRWHDEAMYCIDMTADPERCWADRNAEAGRAVAAWRVIRPDLADRCEAMGGDRVRVWLCIGEGGQG